MRYALSHGASFACEYCESKAKYIVTSALDKKKAGKLAWPFSTYNGPLRTKEKIINITEKIESGENVSRDEAKGFHGTSPLLFQDNFDFVDDVPAEYMHLGCLGVIKRLIELTYNVGENRKRNTTRKLSDVSKYNKLIINVKVAREISRRQRYLDFGVLKAQDLRNVILIFFPIVLENINDKYVQEKKIWLQLAYIMKSCVIPNKEFEELSKELIEKTSQNLYKNYESVYGENNCTYSIHVFLCHALQIRGNEPLTEKSAFKFENFYSELRNLFQPGTASPSKQILENCFMKRKLEHHNCVKSIFYDVEKKGKENNSVVYFMDDDKIYHFFNIIKINADGSLVCNPQGRHPFKCDIVKNLNWEKIGVFKSGPFSNEKITIPRNKIEGKVFRVLDFLITCPNNVLREQ